MDLLVLLLASLYPLLQQVLIVAVCSGSQCVHALVCELSVVRVDEHGHETVQLAVQLVDLFHNLSHRSLKHHDQRSDELICARGYDVVTVMDSSCCSHSFVHFSFGVDLLTVSYKHAGCFK